MDIKPKIGLRIKEIRTEKELTQEAVAFIQKFTYSRLKYWKKLNSLHALRYQN
jgi:transcriptional regulator with XRE-family HTH domain